VANKKYLVTLTPDEREFRCSHRQKCRSRVYWFFAVVGLRR
jgi:hypothetical protein